MFQIQINVFEFCFKESTVINIDEKIRFFQIFSLFSLKVTMFKNRTQTVIAKFIFSNYLFSFFLTSHHLFRR